MHRFNRFGPLKGMLTYRDRTDELISELIAERRAEGETERDDVLAMLLAARHEDGSQMTAQELRDELMTLLVAGHETTASTLAWAFERLAREPAVLGRLTEEVRSDDGRRTTSSRRSRRRCAAARSCPTASRGSSSSRSRSAAGTTRPASASSPTPTCSTTTPRSIPSPTRSARSGSSRAKPGTYTWIPFGGGRRRCIGMSFAMLEMQIVILRSVLRRYELTSEGAHEVPRRRNITVRPGRGARVGLAPVAQARPRSGMSGEADGRLLDAIGRRLIWKGGWRTSSAAPIVFTAVGFLLAVFLDADQGDELGRENAPHRDHERPVPGPARDVDHGAPQDGGPGLVPRGPGAHAGRAPHDARAARLHRGAHGGPVGGRRNAGLRAQPRPLVRRGRADRGRILDGR